MNIETIEKIIGQKQVNIDIEAGITLKIHDDAFKPGTVRVHLPAPINASWLKEGQLLDAEPFFRMASVEDYPQRSVYFNERLTDNVPFAVRYAFTSVHSLIVPDIQLIDSTAQKGFSQGDVERFKGNHQCGCESYTALPHDAVSILDVIEDKGIVFSNDYENLISTIKSRSNIGKNGSLALAIFRFIIENFDRLNRNDHNIAFVSMCRMCGIPARWQGGWALKDGKAVGHDWAMVHLLPYGWIYIDADFGAEAFKNKSSLNGMELSSFFFGNVDPCMVPTASVPKADLYPAKDYERADETFNTYGEVELVPEKMGSDGHFDGYGLKKKDFTSEILLKC